MKTASVVEGEFPISHCVREDVGKEFVTFSVPNGWDDVKKVTKKVLMVEGKRFTFSCWNSDRLECVFSRPIGHDPMIGKFVNR